MLLTLPPGVSYDPVRQQMQRLTASSRARKLARSATVLACGAVVCALAVTSPAAQDRKRQTRLDDALRREGDALLRLADDAARGRALPADFALEWRNDFFKAQPGTFVPFTITFDASALTLPRALMYVRAEAAVRSREDRRRSAAPFAYETIFPVDLHRESGGVVRIRRGFAVPPGRYRLVVAIREYPEDPLIRPGAEGRKAAALVRDLEVPDFWTGELTTSTIVLAERIEPLREPVPAGELDEHPYVIGTQRIHPAPGTAFPRTGELIVAFLVYNPTVASDKHFDLQVDYHLYRRDQAPGAAASQPGDRPLERLGERYVTRTNPQRFNPLLMGPGFDPRAGAPVLAGQGILLSAFDPGEYRLGITVTDLLSRKTVARDVHFTVVGS